MSDDGTLELQGAAASGMGSCGDLFHSCGQLWTLDAGAYFYVAVDRGSGFEGVCWGDTFPAAGSCEGSIAVPPGTPVECLMYIWVRTGAQAAVAEMSCF